MGRFEVSKSFLAVEEKLLEAAFFLERLKECSSLKYEGRHYFSAFVSAARSVTWTMQANLNEVPGFSAWYSSVQSTLRHDVLAKLFVDIRNVLQKQGRNPFGQVSIEHLSDSLKRQFAGDRSPFIITPDPVAPNRTVLSSAHTVSEQYFMTLVNITWDCCNCFRPFVDSRWYFTSEHFRSQDRTIVDALAELGFPPEWAEAIPDGDEEGAWRVIRSREPACGLNDLFQRYLGKELIGPDDAD